MKIDVVNRRTYARDEVLNYYDGLTDLFPAEEVLFEKYAEKIANSKVLDIGIGGGRTTSWLMPKSSDYTGVDYVPGFIKRVKEKYEGGKFLVADARSLIDFSDEMFDFVLFSYNGIDAVSHSDRLMALREIHRVLKPGGVFMFSSHNRSYPYFGRPYWLSEMRPNLRLLKNVASYLFFLPRHLLRKRNEIYMPEYAIINDSDHRYSLYIYYIDIAAQIRQLQGLGFLNIEAFNADGVPIRTDTESFWIYYIAHKE